MLAFKVYVNKAKVCTAGMGELESILASLVCRIDPDGRPDERRISFLVGGAADRKFYKWVDYDMLVGHQIEIRIVDASKADPPKEQSCPGGACAV